MLLYMYMYVYVCMRIHVNISVRTAKLRSPLQVTHDVANMTSFPSLLGCPESSVRLSTIPPLA